jgi:hypothetical protein
MAKVETTAPGLVPVYQPQGRPMPVADNSGASIAQGIAVAGDAFAERGRDKRMLAGQKELQKLQFENAQKLQTQQAQLNSPLGQQITQGEMYQQRFGDRSMSLEEAMEKASQLSLKAEKQSLMELGKARIGLENTATTSRADAVRNQQLTNQLQHTTAELQQAPVLINEARAAMRLSFVPKKEQARELQKLREVFGQMVQVDLGARKAQDAGAGVGRDFVRSINGQTPPDGFRWLKPFEGFTAPRSIKNPPVFEEFYGKGARGATKPQDTPNPFADLQDVPGWAPGQSFQPKHVDGLKGVLSLAGNRLAEPDRKLLEQYIDWRFAGSKGDAAFAENPGDTFGQALTPGQLRHLRGVMSGILSSVNSMTATRGEANAGLPSGDPAVKAAQEAVAKMENPKALRVAEIAGSLAANFLQDTEGVAVYADLEAAKYHALYQTLFDASIERNPSEALPAFQQRLGTMALSKSLFALKLAEDNGAVDPQQLNSLRESLKSFPIGQETLAKVETASDLLKIYQMETQKAVAEADGLWEQAVNDPVLKQKVDEFEQEYATIKQKLQESGGTSLDQFFDDPDLGNTAKQLAWGMTEFRNEVLNAPEGTALPTTPEQSPKFQEAVKMIAPSGQAQEAAKALRSQAAEMDPALKGATDPASLPPPPPAGAQPPASTSAAGPRFIPFGTTAVEASLKRNQGIVRKWADPTPMPSDLRLEMFTAIAHKDKRAYRNAKKAQDAQKQYTQPQLPPPPAMAAAGPTVGGPQQQMQPPSPQRPQGQGPSQGQPQQPLPTPQRYAQGPQAPQGPRIV